MRAGTLRSTIKLLRYDQVQDSAGGIIGKWIAYATIRADDRVTSTKSMLEAGVDINQEIHTIRIRYRKDINPSDRVEISDGRTLAVEGYPRPVDQKNRELIITAVYDGK